MIDHSTMYTDGTLWNRGHRKRLADILDVVAECIDEPPAIYHDYGCSNGYITEQVATLIDAEKVAGYENRADLISSGKQARPAIDFRSIDLNAAGSLVDWADFVTCFETLEHLGHLDAAVENLVAAIGPGGKALLSVPIEIGPVGLAKYIVKVGVFRYSLDTLEPMRMRRTRYLWALMTGARMSKFRGSRPDWATHFGFDHRDLDELLAETGLVERAWNKGTSRFYLLAR